MFKSPWNAIRWSYKAVIQEIVKEYRSCPNVVEINNKLYCYTWWKHDDCVRIMNILNKITKDDKYSIPPIRQEVKNAIAEIINDHDTIEILKKIEDNNL